MKQIMSELTQDHQHINALLTILKNKLVTLEGSGRPDFNLMSEVLDYLDDYADGYHHVREDLIFNYLCTHHPECDSLVNQARQEHQELAQLTGGLRESVDQVLLDTPFLLHDFTQQLARFIDKQSEHLSMETDRLFPLIEKSMTLNDWQQFASQVPTRQNPLLAQERNVARYQRLYNALIDDLT